MLHNLFVNYLVHYLEALDGFLLRDTHVGLLQGHRAEAVRRKPKTINEQKGETLTQRSGQEAILQPHHFPYTDPVFCITEVNTLPRASALMLRFDGSGSALLNAAGRDSNTCSYFMESTCYAHAQGAKTVFQNSHNINPGFLQTASAAHGYSRVYLPPLTRILASTTQKPRHAS